MVIKKKYKVRIYGDLSLCSWLFDNENIVLDTNEYLKDVDLIVIATKKIQIKNKPSADLNVNILNKFPVEKNYFNPRNYLLRYAEAARQDIPVLIIGGAISYFEQKFNLGFIPFVNDQIDKKVEICEFGSLTRSRTYMHKYVSSLFYYIKKLNDKTINETPYFQPIFKAINTFKEPSSVSYDYSGNQKTFFGLDDVYKPLWCVVYDKNHYLKPKCLLANSIPTDGISRIYAVEVVLDFIKKNFMTKDIIDKIEIKRAKKEYSRPSFTGFYY